MGPEIGEKQLAIDEVRKKISSSQEAAEETVYYAGDIAISHMVSNMMNGSLFAEKRLFIIKCAEAIKKKEDIETLSAFLASVPEDCYLIFISDEIYAFSKSLEKYISPSNKKIFWELLDGRKLQWLNTFFREKGYKISAEGIDTILELVENNTSAFKQECSRLILFLDKDREITGSDVEKWLSHTKEESAFILFTKIAAGDLQRSLESVRVLLAAKESPVAIFAALSSCFKKLMSYLALKEAGRGNDEEYRKIGISSPGAKRDYSAAAGRYNSLTAESCIALCTEYDHLIRSSGSYPEHILMDQYIYKVHSLGEVKR